jgi:F0F1-type ATP synthase assembly protein I
MTEFPEIPPELREAPKGAPTRPIPVKGAKEEAQAWAVATSAVFSIAAGGVLGYALQRWVWPGAAPWLILGGLGVGLLVGMIRFVRDAMAMNK